MYHDPKGQGERYTDTEDRQKLNVQIFFIFQLSDTPLKEMTLLFNLIFSVKSI